MASQYYICERCGEPAKIVHHKTYINRDNINDTSITLSWDNLEALCQDCHNKEHHKADTRRYSFDENGNVIPPIKFSEKGERLPSGGL
jgi:5-methylcytosine-specific restriction endonuclease McrA